MKFFSYWRSLASYRVRIALNLKGLTPDEVIEINLQQGDQRTNTFRQLNPMMALPVLILDDGTTLFESLAILEYLDENYFDPPLLPQEPKARARVRGIAQVISCDTHPLIVPRVREYIEHEFKVTASDVQQWGRHWHEVSLHALESSLASSPETGRFAQSDRLTIADICLCGQAVGAAYFKCDLKPYPTVRRIVDECNKIEAVARAHPLKQPGAPLAL